jgi:hypothetical protein
MCTTEKPQVEFVTQLSTPIRESLTDIRFIDYGNSEKGINPVISFAFEEAVGVPVLFETRNFYITKGFVLTRNLEDGSKCLILHNLALADEDYVKLFIFPLRANYFDESKALAISIITFMQDGKIKVSGLLRKSYAKKKQEATINVSGDVNGQIFTQNMRCDFRIEGHELHLYYKSEISVGSILMPDSMYRSSVNSINAHWLKPRGSPEGFGKYFTLDDAIKLFDVLGISAIRLFGAKDLSGEYIDTLVKGIDPSGLFLHVVRAKA